MTNTKATKRALLASVMALLLCFTMLLGTTYAWFTDSVTSSGNKIVAGTLDVQLLMNADGTGYTDISDNTAPIFGDSSIAQNNNAETLWEPGKTQVAYLAIKNGGTLDLKYTVGLNVQNVSKDLYEVMEYAIVPDAQYDSVTSWTGGNSVAVGTQSVSGDVELKAGEIHYFALAIHMDEEASNTYQNGEVDFNLTVLATQLASEEDAFDATYDEAATYPDVWDGTVGTVPAEVDGVVTISTAAEFAAFANDVNVNKNTYSGKTVVLANDIDLNKMPWTPIGQTGATEFKGTFDGQGNTIKNLYVDSSAQTGEHYSSALFGWIESHAQGITIKNVNVDGATIIGHHNVAVIAGYMEGDSVVENCNVIDATLKNTHANDGACGDKTGVIAGYVAGEVTVKGCTATDCTVTGGRDAGQLIGASYAVPVDCSATNVTVSATDDCTGENIANDLVGRKLGSAWN